MKVDLLRYGVVFTGATILLALGSVLFESLSGVSISGTIIGLAACMIAAQWEGSRSARQGHPQIDRGQALRESLKMSLVGGIVGLFLTFIVVALVPGQMALLSQVPAWIFALIYLGFLLLLTLANYIALRAAMRFEIRAIANRMAKGKLRR